MKGEYWMDRRILDGQENTGWIGKYWMDRRIVDGKENTGWIGE